MVGATGFTAIALAATTAAPLTTNLFTREGFFVATDSGVITFKWSGDNGFAQEATAKIAVE